MLIFWHIFASFFFVLGFLGFSLELIKAFCRDENEGLWLTVFIDRDNEDKVEKLLRKASSFSSEVPVMVCCREISPETELLCDRLCLENGFEFVGRE